MSTVTAEPGFAERVTAVPVRVQPVTPGRALLHDGGGELVTVQVPY